MRWEFDQALGALRAVAESTRLRILAVLQHGELSVTELTEILMQSQPRTSRHLKVLTDAAVIDRHRAGNRVFFSLFNEGPARAVAETALSSIVQDDPVFVADRERLDRVRTERARAADRYFSDVARDWDEVRVRQAPQQRVESAILTDLADIGYRSLLDLGTGTGRMLDLLHHPGLDRVVGIDASAAMLAVARSRLGNRPTIELRHQDLHGVGHDGERFDLVIMHQVLHYLDDPDRALRHASTIVSPGGHLLVVDVATHQVELLQRDHAHRRLGFDHETVQGWMTDAGLVDVQVNAVAPTRPDGLTVVIWRGRRPAQQVAIDEHLDHRTHEPHARDLLRVTVPSAHTTPTRA